MRQDVGPFGHARIFTGKRDKYPERHTAKPTHLPEKAVISFKGSAPGARPQPSTWPVFDLIFDVLLTIPK
jgi:hypothetical protein